SRGLLSNDGTNAAFITNGGGTFISPPGMDADLFQHSSSDYTLTFHKTEAVWTFSQPAQGGNALLLTSVSDRNGNTITYSYTTDSHRLASVTDTEGRTLTVSDDAAGFPGTLADWTGRQVSFTYDASGELSEVTDANGGVWHYGYDPSENLDQITDPDGHVTTLSYDSSRRVSSITQVTDTSAMTGPTTAFTYSPGSASSPGSGQTVVTDPNGHYTTYSYDSFDRVSSVTNALGHSRSSTYTPNSDPQALTDALSNVTTLSYDNSNNLAAIQSPSLGAGQSGAATTYSYATPGSVSGGAYLPSSSTNPQGDCSAYTYDPSGNLATTYGGLAPGGSGNCDGQSGSNASTASYQGDSGVSCGARAGELCSQTDANGNVTTYGYDSSGNLTSVTPPSPKGRTTIVPDAVSRPSSVTDGRGDSVSYTYDANDHIKELSYSDGIVVSYTYDADGNLVSRTDPSGSYHYGYDDLGRLTSVSLPDGADACPGSSPASIELSYDGASNLATYCDGAGTTTYGYDAANEVTSLAEPGGDCASPVSLCSTFSYDANGRRTETTFPAGASQSFSYDQAGSVSSAIGSDSSSKVVSSFSYAYADGSKDSSLRQAVTESDPMGSGTTTYGYDPLGRLTSASSNQGSPGYEAAVLADHPLAYWRLGESQASAPAADSSGNGNTGTYSSSGVTLGAQGAIAGDANTAATFDGSSGGMTAPDTSALRLNGSFSIELWAKQGSFDNTYPGLLYKGDDSGYLIYEKPDGTLSFKRNDTEATTTPGALVAGHYHYYVVTYDGTSLDWYVDGKLDSSTPESYPTNTATDALAIGKGDDFGNDTIDEVALYAGALAPSTVSAHYQAGEGGGGSSSWSYGYDQVGNMTSKVAGGVSTSYSYDAPGQTTSASPAGGSATTTLSYGDVGQSLLSTDGPTAMANGPLGLDSTTTAGRSTYFVRDPSGNLLGEVDPAGDHWYYLRDGLGSVVAVIDGSGGTVADRYSYDPYGNLLASQGSLPNPYRYAGGYYDSQSGLYHFGQRFYDSVIARWTQPDPIAGSIANPASLDGYLYAGDDPVNFVDVGGESLLSSILNHVIGGLAGGIAGLVVLGLTGNVVFTFLAFACTSGAVSGGLAALEAKGTLINGLVGAGIGCEDSLLLRSLLY
ncbi:MAG: LamG-like jellyroll fold domain-containing protein, partial [Acidimicrobiales bacterium]